VKEENCIILDFLPTGYSNRRHPEPIAQAVGCKYFSLLEIVPKDDVILKPDQIVYIGEGKREEVKFIKDSISYDTLTNAARSMLEGVLEYIVKQNEVQIIEFFNKASMITPRMHQMQLIPGIGKKHLVDMLNERRKKPFENFKDLSSRVRMFPDPEKAIMRRIMDELKGEQKYYLFVSKAKKR